MSPLALPPLNGPVTVTITGPAGAGKTRLANHLLTSIPDSWHSAVTLYDGDRCVGSPVVEGFAPGDIVECVKGLGADSLHQDELYRVAPPRVRHPAQTPWIYVEPLAGGDLQVWEAGRFRLIRRAGEFKPGDVVEVVRSASAIAPTERRIVTRRVGPMLEFENDMGIAACFRVVKLAPEPDAEGWIVWSGGACPVHPNARVQFKMRTGNVGSGRAGSCAWAHPAFAGDDRVDILAYRLIRPAPAPDANGWIPWHGGICPIRGDAKIEIRMRNGQTRHCPAGVNAWAHPAWRDSDGSHDIVAYRLVTAEATRIVDPRPLPPFSIWMRHRNIMSGRPPQDTAGFVEFRRDVTAYLDLLHAERTRPC